MIKNDHSETPGYFENALSTLRNLLSEGEFDEHVKTGLQQAIDQIAQGASEVRVQQGLLAEAQMIAEQAIRSKSDFLSRVSHEIRTPINAISGMAHISQGSEDIEHIKQCLEVIANSSKQLLGIINDVLDMSGFEAGTVDIAQKPFDFESMLMKLAGKVSVKAEAKKQKLYCNIDVDMPAHFHGDEQRLSQVIYNLLSNAVKFTPEGGAISVTAKQIAREAEQSTIEISVSDNGIGISATDQLKLFQPFYQTDGSSARQFGGTGLGLTIVKQLVEMMHGTIQVKSDLDRGSTFKVTVKLTALDESPSAKVKENGDVSGMNVLIVDPDQDTQQYFSQVMDSFKVHSQSAGSVEDALHLVEQGRKTGNPVSILYLDWSLAEKDGVKVAQTLKRQYSVSTVAMLPMAQMMEAAITGNADSGMSYIAKPLFPSELLRSIYEIAGSPIRPGAHAVGTRCSFSGHHVLLVEDVEINRRIFDQIMQDTQLVISHAENGAIAVEMFRQNPDCYDIILMDIHMPVMDGYEATRHIRNLPIPRAQEVPIVAVTANAFAADVERSQQAGMNGHLTKPIEVDKMFKVMYELLKPEDKLHQKKKADEVTDAEQAEYALALAETKLRQNPYIDYDDALKKVRGSMRVLKILLQSFASNHQLEQFMAEVDSGDYEVAARTAHAISGACANLSLNLLKEKIDEFEMQLKSRFHIEKTKQEVETVFVATLEGINEALHAMRQIAKD